MRRLKAIAVLVVIATLVTAASAAAAPPATRNFRAHLAGRNEVGYTPMTLATGQAVFQFNKQYDAITYRLIVANIENVFMSHIHMGAADANGPIVVWLYPFGGPPSQLIPGRFSSVLATGTMTAADLTGPLGGMELSDLWDAMMAGDTYVQVHTDQYPAGEIRGQIH